jgi:hypothetical protein
VTIGSRGEPLGDEWVAEGSATTAGSFSLLLGPCIPQVHVAAFYGSGASLRYLLGPKATAALAAFCANPGVDALVRLTCRLFRAPHPNRCPRGLAVSRCWRAGVVGVGPSAVSCSLVVAELSHP